jgi:hypothetical protein
MSLCHQGFLSLFPIPVAAMSGLYGLYLLLTIRADANRLRNDTKLRFFWIEYGKLFPASHKRAYCVLCMLLFFTIPIFFVGFCFLTTGEF